MSKKRILDNQYVKISASQFTYQYKENFLSDDNDDEEIISMKWRLALLSPEVKQHNVEWAKNKWIKDRINSSNAQQTSLSGNTSNKTSKLLENLCQETQLLKQLPDLPPIPNHEPFIETENNNSIFQHLDHHFPGLRSEQGNSIYYQRSIQESEVDIDFENLKTRFEALRDRKI